MSWKHTTGYENGLFSGECLGKSAVRRVACCFPFASPGWVRRVRRKALNCVPGGEAGAVSTPSEV